MDIDPQSISKVAAIAMVVKVLTVGAIVPTANGIVPLTIIKRREIASIEIRLRSAIAVSVHHIKLSMVREVVLWSLLVSYLNGKLR
jgi:hypothetical protein